MITLHILACSTIFKLFIIYYYQQWLIRRLDWKYRSTDFDVLFVSQTWYLSCFPYSIANRFEGVFVSSLNRMYFYELVGLSHRSGHSFMIYHQRVDFFIFVSLVTSVSIKLSLEFYSSSTHLHTRKTNMCSVLGRGFVERSITLKKIELLWICI